MDAITTIAAITSIPAPLADQARCLLTDFKDVMRNTVGEVAAPCGRLRISAPISFGW
jgi:hypothetical protein